MGTTQILVSLDDETVAQLGALVKNGGYTSLDSVVAESIAMRLALGRSKSLAEQCALLDPENEKALAEEGMSEALRSWPEY